MLPFADTKKLEKALGEEAASVIAHVFEKADDMWRQDLATRADLQNEVQNLHVKIAETKHDILRWMMGGFLAQTALLVAVMAFLKAS